MEDTVVTVSIPLDDNGFLDRQCHGEHCGRYFKVLDADWEAAETTSVTCPFCGHEDEPDNFTTEEQQEYIQQIALSIAQEQLQEMLAGFARQVNRQQSRNSILSINVKTKFNPIPVPVSPEAVESMRLQITCDTCGCTYAVIGAGFFCPLCGTNSARQTFWQALAKARNAVEVARELGGRQDNRDLAAEARRDALENQISNLVTAFQRYGEAVYPELPKYTIPPARNLFQRLKQASEKWQGAGGRSFESMLSPAEWQELLTYFQQRHVLSHQDGFVDAEYADKSGDTTYRVGQRLVITEAQVLHMAALVEKLGDEMQADVREPGERRQPQIKDVPASPFPAKVPGTTDEYWLVFRIICDCAVQEDEDFLSGSAVWQACSQTELTEELFGESLEVLASKSLITLSRVIGSRHVPAGITVTRRGLERFFANVMPDYAERRKQIASLLLEGESNSQAIVDTTGLSRLFIHHTLKDFESRGWIGRILWNGGIAIIALGTPVHLKRYVAA